MSAAAGQLVVLDRDGVINQDSDDYIKSPSEWHAIPGSLQAIAGLHRAGFHVVVVSNQSGVGRGLYSAQTLKDINARMEHEVEAAGGALAGVYCCPHRPEEGCACRKPAPGLLRQIERDFGTSLRGAPLIGDKLSDIDAALAVGARPMLVRTGYGLQTAKSLGDRKPEVHADLASAVAALLDGRRGS